MDLDVRPTDLDDLAGEVRRVASAMRTALLFGPPTDEEWEKFGQRWSDQISWSAWDGDRAVGHAGAFRFDTIVPGGARLPTAGLTRVGVLPTHTRRGLLSRMITAVLKQARSEGAVLTSLRASEAVIYGRFGYGLGGERCLVSLDVRRARPIANAAPGSVRLLDRSAVLDVVPPLYERILRRAGNVTRATPMWQYQLEDVLTGDKPNYVAVHTGVDGEDDGFVHYSVKWTDGSSVAEFAGLGEVHDLWGVSPQVELALWRYLCDIDLVRRYTCDQRPEDDPMRLAVADPRAWQVTERIDEQWLRLLDVEAALRARTYRPGPAVAIAVHDPMFDENTGTFVVDHGEGAVDVRRGGADERLTVDISTLSAAYLGATSWRALADAGRVDGPAHLVDIADDRFAHRPTAFCGTFF
jgi:predicted acetyltransferase